MDKDQLKLLNEGPAEMIADGADAHAVIAKDEEVEKPHLPDGEEVE